MINFQKTKHCPKNWDIEDVVGQIKYFAHENDKRPLKYQFNERYCHGGGWNNIDGFMFDKEDLSLSYPGDPKLYPLVCGEFRDQKVYIYPYSLVLILDPDGSFEVSRMD